MNLKNCRTCNKLFSDAIHNTCFDCREKEEEDYKKVYDYLREADEANIDEIHEATEVEKKQIIKMIREGRFSMLKEAGLNVFVECKSCGKPIQEGDYCKACSNKLIAAIESENKPRTYAGKMHTAGRLKGRKKS